MKSCVTRVFQVLPGALLLLGTVSTLRGQGAVPTSWIFPPGASVCTSQFESTSVFFNGYAYNRGTFTVVMSTTPTGATQTVFKHAGDVDSQLVRPPAPGFYFWRICVQNTSKDTTAFEIQGGPGGSVPSSAPSTYTAERPDCCAASKRPGVRRS